MKNDWEHLKAGPHCLHQEQFASFGELDKFAKFCSICSEWFLAEDMFVSKQCVSSVFIMVGMWCACDKK